jgi:hypothetical protein
MSRLWSLLLVLSVLAVPAIAPTPATADGGLRAGYGEADATWVVGSCAGQYCDARDPSTDPLSGDTDPYGHNRLKEASSGIQSRMTTRAIVVDGTAVDGTPRRIALVKSDLYLAQDLLSRRVAQILADAGSPIAADDILHAATHNHSSPYYSTLAAGVWVFEDVFDARFLEHTAQAMAEAILQAEAALEPARMSATTVHEDVFKANIVGLQTADDGSPAGYPRDFGDTGVTVMAFRATADDRPIAAWVNHGQHPEGLDGYGLITADFLAPFERFVQRDTGFPVVFSQGDVGSSEGPYSGWENALPLPSGELRAWAHVGFAQLERGARYLADTVVEALGDIDGGTAAIPWTADAPVDRRSAWVPGPLSHPYPSVSNCRTDTTAQGTPGAPVVGLPDCGREDALSVPGLPGQQVVDLAEAEGVGVPDHYDAPSYGAVEENARLRLQAFRVGEVLMASCACEAQVDLVLNLESRTDDVEGNMWLGYDWSARCVEEGGGVAVCDRAPDRGPLTAPMDAIDLMRHQVGNDAAGWDDPANALAAMSENPDRQALWGNFTHDELPADLGYGLPVGVGHAGDYNGYTVSYREYMAYDHYRKALTAYGPHTADYMVTRLVALARAMIDPAYELPAELHDPALLADEARQVALAETVGRQLAPLSAEYEAALPDDPGPAEVLVQPADITRFAAAFLSWRGGTTAVDTPVARVEREVDGAWVPFADGSGEVPVTTDLPDGPQGTLGALSGEHEWVWTAAFEAFSAFPARLGQTPVGTYRFVVEGQRREGGQTVPYELVSEPFTVSPYDGLVVEGLAVGSTAAGEDAVTVVVADSTYPRTYASPFAMIGDDGGERRAIDAGLPHDMCRTCTFRPWAQRAAVTSVAVTVTRPDGSTSTHQATPDGEGRWTATGLELASGDVVGVERGGVVDANGEINGEPVSATVD